MPWDENGHEMKPGDKFCPLCGEQPVTQCKNGHELREEYDNFGNAIQPNYCHECGVSYPWAQ